MPKPLKCHRYSRRDAIRIGALGIATAASAPAFGQQFGQQQPFGQQQAAPRRGPTEITVDEANLRPRPIAVPDFIADDPKLGQDAAGVVSANLERSGLFQPLDKGAFIEQLRDVNVAPRFADWRAVGAEALVAGRLNRLPDGRIGADFQLWDVVLGKPLDRQKIATSPQNWRRIGHILADRVYEKLTLEKGYFDTRIVFIDEQGPKDRRQKRLAIMDQDGFNLRLLTQGKDLVLTPRFSPTSQEITFMSYANEQPRVYLMNLNTGQRDVVGDFPGMTFAPRFAPDGQRIVMSLQQDGISSLVELDLRSRQSRRLTQSQAIDTGPCFAPNGRQIVFESDREGSQQLYVMNADGSGTRRISGGEGRYSTPVWSPRGDYIAFTKQMGGSFLIGVMKTDGSAERVLTEGYHNEGPTWAPNGRVLMFFREQQGASGGPKIFSIDLTGYNERQVITPGFASDPAWSPLLA